MNNKLTTQELHEIIERRSTGRTGFAEFLEELSKVKKAVCQIEHPA